MIALAFKLFLRLKAGSCSGRSHNLDSSQMPPISDLIVPRFLVAGQYYVHDTFVDGLMFLFQLSTPAPIAVCCHIDLHFIRVLAFPWVC